VLFLFHQLRIQGNRVKLNSSRWGEQLECNHRVGSLIGTGLGRLASFHVAGLRDRCDLTLTRDKGVDPPEIVDTFVAEQRVRLEEAEQFEHDHDNYNHSNYVENISIHAAINTRPRQPWSTFVQIYQRSGNITLSE
jgi:hypothetical protein